LQDSEQDMNPSLTPLLIGAAAGVAAALLSVGSVVQTTLSFLLFILSPLPLMLAGLGWGPAAGLSAGVVCCLAILGFAGTPQAIIIALTTVIPATLAAYYGGMARIENDHPIEWYPLGSILFALAATVAFSFVATGIYLDFPAISADLSVELVKRIAAADSELAKDPVATISLANLIIKAIPFIQPATWLLVLVGNFWAALLISRRSGLFRRPKDDWPTSLRMPSRALPIFAVTMTATFMTGGWQMIAWCVAGAFAMAFILTGFAALHRVSRGKQWRGAALWVAYATSLTIGLPVILILFAGVYDTAKKPAANGGAPTQ
jgi:hypothetical protein